MTHAVIRTSPYGQPFRGRCRKCGEENLNLSGALIPCPADAQYSDEEALLDIINEDQP